jgi:hypothetical protein
MNKFHRLWLYPMWIFGWMLIWLLEPIAILQEKTYELLNKLTNMVVRK